MFKESLQTTITHFEKAISATKNTNRRMEHILKIALECLTDLQKVEQITEETIKDYNLIIVTAACLAKDGELGIIRHDILETVEYYYTRPNKDKFLEYTKLIGDAILTKRTIALDNELDCFSALGIKTTDLLYTQSPKNTNNRTSLFSPPKVITQREEAINLFDSLINSRKLPFESNQILKVGLEILKNPNLEQTQLDKTIIAALLLALAKHDFNHWKSKKSHVSIPSISEEIKSVWEKLYKKNISMKELISIVGEKVLINKTIPFTGEYSVDKELNSTIKKGLHLSAQRFEGYETEVNEKACCYIL